MAIFVPNSDILASLLRLRKKFDRESDRPQSIFHFLIQAANPNDPMLENIPAGIEAEFGAAIRTGKDGSQWDDLPVWKHRYLSKDKRIERITDFVRLAREAASFVIPLIKRTSDETVGRTRIAGSQDWDPRQLLRDASIAQTECQPEFWVLALHYFGWLHVGGTSLSIQRKTWTHEMESVPSDYEFPDRPEVGSDLTIVTMNDLVSGVRFLPEITFFSVLPIDIFEASVIFLDFVIRAVPNIPSALESVPPSPSDSAGAAGPPGAPVQDAPPATVPSCVQRYEALKLEFNPDQFTLRRDSYANSVDLSRGSQKWRLLNAFISNDGTRTEQHLRETKGLWRAQHDKDDDDDDDDDDDVNSQRITQAIHRLNKIISTLDLRIESERETLKRLINIHRSDATDAGGIGPDGNVSD